MVTGDDRICRLVEWEMPGVHTVEVKRSLGFAAAESLSPAEACARIERAVTEACGAVDAFAVPVVPDSFVLEADYGLPLAADLAQLVPGTLRTGGRTVQREVHDVLTLVDLVSAWYYLGGVAAQQWSVAVNRR